MPAQLAHCRRYVQGHGWIVGQEFTDVMSGKRDDRPDYQSMLADAWEECKALGVEIHSGLEGGMQSDLVFDILASVATAEARAAGSPRSTLEPDPRAAPHVAESFRRVGAGESTRKVAESLALLSDEERGGYRATRRTLQDALRSPVYAGRQTRRRAELRMQQIDLADRPLTRWPALVTDDVWNAVQDRLDGRRQ